MRITSCASAPSAWQRSPISLEKHTFKAWKALQTYLTISAVRTVVCTTGAETSVYNDCTAIAVRSSSLPTSTNGG